MDHLLRWLILFWMEIQIFMILIQVRIWSMIQLLGYWLTLYIFVLHTC